MALVIVTKKCYLLCERVNNITLQEEAETVLDEYIVPHWCIHIDFEPTPSSNPQHSKSRDDGRVILKIGDQAAAYGLFNDIVSQIREQMPDQLYLDKLVEKFLTEGALNEQTIDRKYDEIRRAGEAKRKRKKVLRRSKSRNRKSR